jgi:hypothetical protein
MGAALIEVAKRPQPTQAGAPPGSTQAPKGKGVGSASLPSNSSPKPKVRAVTKGDDLAEMFLTAVRQNETQAVSEVLVSLRGLDAEQTLLFKSLLENGPLKDAVDASLEEFQRQPDADKVREEAESISAAQA